jgi:hypothetical protein
MTISRGSIWRRWDPHLHAPGTLLNDQFAGNWKGFLTRIEEATPPVEVIGVTDYFCISTYREMLKHKAAGRMPTVQLLFPNVELRLNIRTERSNPINLHLLFSPEQKDHVQQIERILAQLEFSFQGRSYRCTLDELRELGRAFDPKQADSRAALEAGAGQFKVGLDKLRELFGKEKWLEKNCLVAVSGSGVDGTLGLRKDDSFTATRREIEAFSDLVFSSHEKQRTFWLGKSESATADEIVAIYGSLKPCVHGSDAHESARVLAPDKDRYCWVKGDPTFESLRQVTLEPEERLWIGRNPPDQGNPTLCISEVRVKNAPWVSTDQVLLNQGLVTIIGAKGSGKTALADMIAAGSGAFDAREDQSSFLGRAGSLLGDTSVETIWGDDTRTEKPLHEDTSFDVEEMFEYEPSGSNRKAVCYLSQHFVEKLCAAGGLAVELKTEVERVIFESMDSTEHLETDSFDDLHQKLVGAVHRRREDLQRAIRETGGAIVVEENLKASLPRERKRAEDLQQGIGGAKKALSEMVPKGDEDLAKAVSILEDAQVEVEAKVEELRNRKSRLAELSREIRHIREVKEPARFDKMIEDFRDAGLPDADWKAFRMEFVGDPSAIVAKAIGEVDGRLVNITTGDAKKEWKAASDPNTWPLNKILEALQAKARQISSASQQRLKYDNIQQETKRKETTLRRLQAELQRAEGADQRREKLIASRRENYIHVFETFVEEEDALKKMYEPLRLGLSGSDESLRRLTFGVRRKVSLGNWIAAGEKLIDLRNTSKFRGKGALEKVTREYLLKAWESGIASEVADAMERFRNDCQRELLKARPSSEEDVAQWQQRLANWLYGTDHISLEYGIQYNNVSIEQLSPGTRGIVLLLLYLAIDEGDRRPLVIDQPEENLDPNSVFAELVPHFRSARKRRQVIVVTHNANLVVNTDADQVIVARAAQKPEGGLPTLSYQSGSLEDPEIRGLVCELLEGGERAFLEREKRYRIKWKPVGTR